MRGRKFIFSIIIATAVGGIFLFLVIRGSRVIDLKPLAPAVSQKVIDSNGDIEPQKPLVSPPSPIKAIYATNWSAAGSKKMNYFFDLLNTTELNAIVIDIKDYTGIVGYEPDVPAVKEYKAFEKRIPRINALIKKLHDAGVYVIGRIAVFQDVALVRARPDLALRSKKTGGIWGDRKGVHWLDTAATPVWDYNVDIARDALARGFDEVNFDYIRFASDGDMSDIAYPYFDETRSTKREVVSQFFKHLRSQIPYQKISADIFGEAVVNYQETGIGQFVEDTIEPFDYVAPMIYPSHFHKNFLGLSNSAAAPYPVIRYAMDRAFDRRAVAREKLLAGRAATSTAPLPALTEFRPWLQDFNLGVTYTAELVRDQILAVDDSARAAAGCPGVKKSDKNNQAVSKPTSRQPCEYQEVGWMLWSPSNVYTKAALLPEETLDGRP